MAAREFSEEEQDFLRLVEAQELQDIADTSKRAPPPEQQRSDLQGPPAVESGISSLLEMIQPQVNAFAKGTARSLRSGIDQFSDFVGSALPQGLEETLVGAREGAQSTPDEFEQALQEQLPSGEGFIDKSLERGGESSPFFLGSGLSASAVLLRSTLMGAAGQGAEEAGVGPVGQALAEIVAGGLPDLGPRLVPALRSGARAVEAPLIEGARNLGLTEQEIAPLLPGPVKRAGLGKVARKSGRAERALSRTDEALGRSMNDLRQRPASQVKIPSQMESGLQRNMEKVLQDVPQSTRAAIAEDVEIMFNGGVSGSDVIGFWRKMNKLPAKQRDVLGRLRGPLTETLATIDPALATDFKLTNDLFGRFVKIRKSLKPGHLDSLLEAGEIYNLAQGVLTGDMFLLAEVAGVEGSRRLATEMLVNPRFQNLSARTIKAINQGKLALANKSYDAFIDEVRKVDPGAADQLAGVKFDGIFGNEKKKKRGPEVPDLSEDEFDAIFGGG